MRTDLIPIRSEAGSSPSCSCSLKLRWRLFRPGCWDVYAYWSTASTCGHTDICIYVRLYRRPCICMRKWPIRSTDRPTTHRGPLKDRACVVKLFKYITPGPQLQLHKFIHAGIHQRPYLCPNLQLELGPSRAKSFGPNSFSWPALSSTVHCAVLGLWKSVLYAGRLQPQQAANRLQMEQMESHGRCLFARRCGHTHLQVPPATSYSATLSRFSLASRAEPALTVAENQNGFY